MKIAACVILYNPNEPVISNIQSYIHHLDKLYLIDNSESINTNLQEVYNPLVNTIIIRNGINEGIAKRLNQACDLAIKNEFDYLLTMDQDSYFDETSIAEYFQCIKNFDKIENIAMFGVNYESQTRKENCKHSSVKFLITSGSIINLNAYKHIGSFDENLFIDFVDMEYCFRSISNGYQIIRFSNIFMHHEIGEVTHKRSFKNLKSSTRSIHSTTRLYYMTRNFLYLNKKYKNQFREELKTYRKDLINRIKNKLLYHSARYKTLKSLFRAFKDYRNIRMGKQL